VAQADIAVLGDVDGKRQVAAEQGDAAVFNDHRAVVAHGMGIEDAGQQGLAEPAVERDAAGQMAVQRITARNDDQCADALFGQIARRLGDDPRRLFHLRQGPDLAAQIAQHRQALEKTAQVFLKDHHQHEKQNGEKALQDDQREVKLEKPGQEVHAAQKQNADQNKARRPRLEPHQKREDHRGDDHHIQDILYPDALDHRCGGSEKIHKICFPVRENFPRVL